MNYYEFPTSAGGARQPTIEFKGRYGSFPAGSKIRFHFLKSLFADGLPGGRSVDYLDCTSATAMVNRRMFVKNKSIFADAQPYSWLYIRHYIFSGDSKKFKSKEILSCFINSEIYLDYFFGSDISRDVPGSDNYVPLEIQAVNMQNYIAEYQKRAAKLLNHGYDLCHGPFLLEKLSLANYKQYSHSKMASELSDLISNSLSHASIALGECLSALDFSIIDTYKLIVEYDNSHSPSHPDYVTKNTHLGAFSEYILVAAKQRLLIQIVFGRH